MTWQDVGVAQDFPLGALRSVTVGNRSVLLVRMDDGFYAMDGRCSHMNADLGRGRLEGHGVECPMHRAVFDLRTGEVIRNLSARKLNTYPVRVEDDRVLIDI